MPYTTDSAIRAAKSLGYKHKRSTHSGDSFTKNDRHIWSIKSGWQTADLVNGSYTNHHKFPAIDDALNRPL